MKTYLKPAIAAILIVLALIWGVSSVLPRSESGTNLAFLVGNGKVTMTNPSTTPIVVQLVGTGSRTFNVISSVEGIAGSSVRDESVNPVRQVFEYSLPAGVSDFTVNRGTSVQFVSTTDTRLSASVQTQSEGETRTIIIVSGLVIIIGLFYISRSTGHRWLQKLLGRSQPVPEAVVAAPSAASATAEANRGRDGRMYSNYGGKE